jgi:mannose-6-phosphate isomerase-like protein (cupin superfamily)
MKPHAPQIIPRPWGSETRWAVNDKYLGKILYIEKGQRLSLQLHEQKDETIYVLKGTAVVQINDKSLILSEGESLRIQPNTVHRFCSTFENPVTLIEVSTPEIDDIVRIEDDYGRVE